MYSKTRTKLGIIYESCKLSGRLIAPLAKVEQSLAVRHIAEYMCRLAPDVRYCRARSRDGRCGGRYKATLTYPWYTCYKGSKSISNQH